MEGPVLRLMNTKISNYQVRLHFMVAFRNWYFINKIRKL